MRSVVAGCECPRGIRRLRAVGRRNHECEQCSQATAPCPAQAAPPVHAVETNPVGEFRHAKVSALSATDRMPFWAVALLWLAVNLAFWGWWLHQTEHSTPWLYWAETIALFYQTTLLPTVFWRFVRKMKRPVEVKPPADMRVAMITLCVPSSESLDVIEGQLAALTNVDYPHDSWILDEGASEEVRALADKHGVNYFTRRGIEAWNQPAPPFQAKTARRPGAAAPVDAPRTIVTSAASSTPTNARAAARLQPPPSAGSDNRRSCDTNSSPSQVLARGIVARVSSCPPGSLIKRWLASRLPRLAAADRRRPRLVHGISPSRSIVSGSLRYSCALTIIPASSC